MEMKLMIILNKKTEKKNKSNKKRDQKENKKIDISNC